MKRAALYLRVSTEKQTVENQRAPLSQLVLARGYEIAEVVTEVESGAKKRPLLDDLCERARRGEFQAFGIAALDRLGRSVLDVLGRVELLDRAGVRILCVRDGWLETEGAARQLMLSVMAGCAQLERDILRERTLAGLARARAQGRKGGRPKASPLAVSAALVRVRGGISVAEAADDAGLSVRTLQRAARASKTPLPIHHGNHSG
jgi:DNA invertase Pin-like site-specific DNA recombinase